MAERLFVAFTREQAAALTMVARRSPAERALALDALAKIRTALEHTDPDPPSTSLAHRVVH